MNTELKPAPAFLAKEKNMKHYTALIEVSMTTQSEGTTDHYGKTTPATREVTDVTKLVIRSETLEGLVKKIMGHTKLMLEEQENNE